MKVYPIAAHVANLCGVDVCDLTRWCNGTQGVQTRRFFNSLSFRAPTTAFGTTTTSNTTKSILIPEDQEGARVGNQKEI